MVTVLPPFEFPSLDDVKTAERFVCGHVPEGTIYTNEQRQEIQRVARQIMMKRKTIQ